MGFVTHFSSFEKFIKMNNLPNFGKGYIREYLFIKGINSQLKFLIKKLDTLNHGLFESKTATIIKNIMKNFLRKQEEGKLKNISDIILPSDIIYNIIYFNKNLEFYKLRYDAFCDDDDDDDAFCDSDDSDDENDEYLVDGKPYPGLIEFYDIFKKIYRQIKNNDSDDSDYVKTNSILLDSDSESDSESDENYDSDDSDDSNDGYFKTISILLDSVCDF